MDKESERSNKAKVLRALEALLSPSGFIHSKPGYFTRSLPPTIEFVHIHKFTFGPSFRAHLGIRVINEPFEAIHLNGPDSDSYRHKRFFFTKSYNFQYQESEESVSQCAEEIFRFVCEVGEPWLNKWKVPSKLQSSRNSPLTQDAKEALFQAMNGSVNEGNVAKTQGLLNAP